MNFASANIDYVYGVEHIVRPGETVPAGTMEIFPGGKGLNQSVAAAKAGGCVYHAGFIGSAGENRIVVFQGINGMFIREYIDPVLKGFSPRGHPPAAKRDNNVPYLIQRAWGNGLRIIPSPSPFDKRLKALELSRKATGRSFCQLLRKYRCDAVAVLLRTTALPVREIIHRVGYKNESFFRRCFRDIYHKSPLEYRKQWSEGR